MSEYGLRSTSASIWDGGDFNLQPFPSITIIRSTSHKRQQWAMTKLGVESARQERQYVLIQLVDNVVELLAG